MVIRVPFHTQTSPAACPPPPDGCGAAPGEPCTFRRDIAGLDSRRSAGEPRATMHTIRPRKLPTTDTTAVVEPDRRPATSAHPCPPQPTGCGAAPHEPCAILPRDGVEHPNPRAGQVRLTMHVIRPRSGERPPDKQPKPKPNDHQLIVPQVINDLQNRAVAGQLKYGVMLQPFNGRDPARDAYEEAQDMTLYLKQLVIERTAMVAEIEQLRAEVARLSAGR
jgi:hypothetical protein